MKLNKNIQELKELAIAYDLSCEFDYCPSKEEKESAENFYGETISDNVFKNYSGNRSDEIARMLVQKVKQFESIYEILNSKTGETVNE